MPYLGTIFIYSVPIFLCKLSAVCVNYMSQDAKQMESGALIVENNTISAQFVMMMTIHVQLHTLIIKLCAYCRFVNF